MNSYSFIVACKNQMTLGDVSGGVLSVVIRDIHSARDKRCVCFVTRPCHPKPVKQVDKVAYDGTTSMVQPLRSGFVGTSFCPPMQLFASPSHCPHRATK